MNMFRYNWIPDNAFKVPSIEEAARDKMATVRKENQKLRREMKKEGSKGE